jgi:tetratricopeptide (TPR) repeat protein
MQFLPRLLLAGFAATALAAPVAGQRSDDQISPKSVELMHKGQAALAAGKLEDAENALESALAVDPRNRWAYVDLARVAEKQQLFGKAIRMTNKALLIEPNDPDAIAVQGEAMVEMGASARAQENLQKLHQGLPAGRATLRCHHARADSRFREGAGQPEVELTPGRPIQGRV